MTRHNVASRLETGTAFIKDLIGDIRKGEIKIPQFQRKFVWKAKQAIQLLDSISNNYPVGSLLLWKTKDKLAVERNIGDFKLPETDDLTPTDYVLDGQQRLTVIYSCVGAPSNEPGFAASYDLKTDSFIEKPEEHVPTLFPLRWVFDTTKLLDFRTSLRGFPEQAVYQERLDEVVTAFNSYKLPIVTLKELSIEEVCPIFERINSSGTKLSIFDLMVAATWAHKQFDLNDASKKIAAALKTKRFSGIKRDAILRCLTAVQSSGIKKGQILGLRDLVGGEKDTVVQKTTQALQRAVDLLSTEFGVYGSDFVPYEAILVILCHTLSKLTAMSSENVKRLRQWFWRASFAERYRVGGESFVTLDIGNVLQFISGKQNDAKVFGEAPSDDRLIKSPFRLGNSRSRAFMLMLGLRKPRNITNGATIDVAEALSTFNRKQFHHVFPAAYLKRLEMPGERNSLMNICMLAASENNRISDSDPHVYLLECASNLGSEADAVFDSNLLPRPSKFDYSKATYDQFLQARSKIVFGYIETICGGNVHP